MDLTSKEARKILRDYYTWYWDNYYENSWKELRGNLSRFLGVDPSLNMHDAMNKAFGYDDAKPYHDKVDHTLDIRRGIEKGVLLEPCDRSHDDVMKDLSKAWKSLDIEDVVLADEYSISDNIDRQTLQKDLREAMDIFGEPDREILMRYYYYYQTAPKIAEVMSLKLEAVKSKIKRGRTKLRAFLTERGY